MEETEAGSFEFIECNSDTDSHFWENITIQ
jgi:hypothetical protein